MPSIEQRFQLADQVAVVIGGAGHICSVLSQALDEVGMKVTALDVMQPAQAKKQLPDTVDYLVCDVTDKQQLYHAKETILKKHGRIDLLINGAGSNAPTAFLEIDPQEIQRIIEVNLVGTLYACQVFGETMLQQKKGSIINFTSVSSGPPLSKAFVYSTAKAGVLNLTQNLAREWATQNVRVNALKPGFLPTEWSMEHFIDDKRKEDILGHTPMNRFAEPEELVGAVLWLASESAGFVTGSIVTVDGGFSAMSI